jgi:hypothetical protein
MMNKPPEMAQLPASWGIYFRVATVHVAAERVKANGGHVLNGRWVPGGDESSTAATLKGRFSRCTTRSNNGDRTLSDQRKQTSRVVFPERTRETWETTAPSHIIQP